MEPRNFREHVVRLKVEFYKIHFKSPWLIVMTRFHLPELVEMTRDVASLESRNSKFPHLNVAIDFYMDLQEKPAECVVVAPCKLFGCTLLIKPTSEDIIEFL